MLSNTRNGLLVMIIGSFFFQSCYRNDIAFGNLPDNNYSNVVFTDTVEPVLSTVTLDSFVTNNASSFLLGKYSDPYLGIISAKPFFQMTVLSDTLNIPSTAAYDSICFIARPNKYYYGDTSRPQTIYVNELSDFINYTYGNNLYNTSSFPVMPHTLGSKTLKIRPSSDTLITVRLNDSKGMELFSKLQQKADEMANDANFQDYFKGISLSVDNNDTTAVYGLSGSVNDVVMRIFYHNTIPYFQSKTFDFTLRSATYSFNQIIPDRNGTLLYSGTRRTQEFPSAQTNNIAFTQYGAGVLLKLTFPYLKGIMSTDQIVKLQKAELLLRPLGSGYDLNKFRLPANLYLAQTDATNAVGASIASNLVPVTDEIYGANTYYKIDVTSYINTLLTTSGTDGDGLFFIGNNIPPNVDRAVIGNSEQALYRTQLLLTVVIIKK